MDNYKYYGQHGEDFLLWNFFDYKNQGFYIDIGAFDGIHLSNSYSFEKGGWSGICVEAHPEYFKNCQQVRPNSTCLNVACVGDEKIETVDFYTEELGLLSGIQEEREEDVRNRYEKRGLEFSGFQKMTVPATTLNQIINQYVPKNTNIDFISIDVEGTEIEVLKGLDLSRIRPRVLILEANTEEAQTEIEDYLVKVHNYHLARQFGVNFIYTSNREDVEKLQNIQVNCQLEKQLHPKGDKYTQDKFIEGAIVQDGKIINPRKKQKSLFQRLLKKISFVVGAK